MHLLISTMVAAALLSSGCATRPLGDQAAHAHSKNVPENQSPVPAQVKVITLDEFMPKRLSVRINVPVVVPAEYELAVLPKASPFEAYWMKHEDVVSANRTQDLPAGNGYMEGRIALSVGYDPRREVFLGADDPDTLNKMGMTMKGISAVTMERYMYGRFPVLLVKMKQEGSGKLLYAMYVALNVDMQVAFVALRPAGNNQVVGDYVWGELKKKLVRVSNIPTRSFL